MAKNYLEFYARFRRHKKVQYMLKNQQFLSCACFLKKCQTVKKIIHDMAVKKIIIIYCQIFF